VKRLKVLREVATQGSFSAAAEALNFTQSAISQHVAALERETGARLVERGARGIRLTDAGRALVAHTEAILCRIDAAEEELAAIAGLRGGRLRLACFQSAGATLVPQAVAVFHGRHPHVELGMVEAEPEAAFALLRAGEIDLALVYDHQSVPAPAQPDVELTPLVEDSYDVILPAGHSLAKRSKLSLSDLADEPWIASTFANGCRRITEEVCRQAGFEPRVAFEADDTMACQALVASGVGVTLMPRLALTSIHPGVAARDLADRPRRKVWAARLETAYRSPASEAMLQILGDVAEEFTETRLALAAS
jgi:DNA-binding transcriptional LysR family regulator